MSQPDLAKAAKVTVRTVGTVERREKNRATHARVRDGLAAALGVLPSYLFTKEGRAK